MFWSANGTIFCPIYAEAEAECNDIPLLARFRSSISACSLSSVSVCCCWRNRISFSREAMRVSWASVLGWAAGALGLLMSTGGDLTIQSLERSLGYLTRSRSRTLDQLGRFRRGGRFLVDVVLLEYYNNNSWIFWLMLFVHTNYLELIYVVNVSRNTSSLKKLIYSFLFLKCIICVFSHLHTTYLISDIASAIIRQPFL